MLVSGRTEHLKKWFSSILLFEQKNSISHGTIQRIGGDLLKNTNNFSQLHRKCVELQESGLNAKCVSTPPRGGPQIQTGWQGTPPKSPFDPEKNLLYKITPRLTVESKKQIQYINTSQHLSNNSSEYAKSTISPSNWLEQNKVRHSKWFGLWGSRFALQQSGQEKTSHQRLGPNNNKRLVACRQAQGLQNSVRLWESCGPCMQGSRHFLHVQLTETEGLSSTVASW